ncbi:globin family protein [Sphingomicrobium sediminis]|uniref:Globin domain-containing protein n=1 Tax=Sphingomicrobium sediminis TaxID=2950949 RepID=A0A9X2ELL7_9SPHN|nr:globin family protein [Sphingomicrobium sediminis]MCM8557624.1 globin domain-containing protein [Sphingomicrobium sediminis]
MTPLQIAHVQNSFDRIAVDAPHFSALFYARLFALNPQLRRLFASDMGHQEQRLMEMIQLVVNSLDSFGGLVPVLRALGERHQDYGVAPRDYDTVGSALLWSLDKVLGTGFSREVKLAWIAAYTIMSTTMLEGARRRAAAA